MTSCSSRLFNSLIYLLSLFPFMQILRWVFNVIFLLNYSRQLTQLKILLITWKNEKIPLILMSSFVVKSIPGGAKYLFTIMAFEWSLSGVRAKMDFEISTFPKFHRAVWALELRLLLQMKQSHVIFQSCLSWIWLFTVFIKAAISTCGCVFLKVRDIAPCLVLVHLLILIILSKFIQNPINTFITLNTLSY